MALVVAGLLSPRRAQISVEDAAPQPGLDVRGDSRGKDRDRSLEQEPRPNGAERNAEERAKGYGQVQRSRRDVNAVPPIDEGARSFGDDRNRRGLADSSEERGDDDGRENGPLAREQEPQLCAWRGVQRLHWPPRTPLDNVGMPRLCRSSRAQSQLADRSRGGP